MSPVCIQVNGLLLELLDLNILDGYIAFAVHHNRTTVLHAADLGAVRRAADIGDDNILNGQSSLGQNAVDSMMLVGRQAMVRPSMVTSAVA